MPHVQNTSFVVKTISDTIKWLSIYPRVGKLTAFFYSSKISRFLYFNFVTQIVLIHPKQLPKPAQSIHNGLL